jgi:hypothetical protein
MSEIEDRVVEAAAHAAHEANRAYCILMGDMSQPPWDEAPRWQRESAMMGVKGVMQGNGPRESHLSWLQHKTEEGWKYGLVKDVEKKEHPCFVPYDDLPPAQKKKDDIYVTVVRSILDAVGYNKPRIM